MHDAVRAAPTKSLCCSASGTSVAACVCTCAGARTSARACPFVNRESANLFVAREAANALFLSMSDHGNGALLLTMTEAARVLSVGRTTMYELVGAGEVEVVHIGRSARVPVAALEEYVERRRAERATVRTSRSAARAER